MFIATKRPGVISFQTVPASDVARAFLTKDEPRIQGQDVTNSLDRFWGEDESQRDVAA
jgi:hypothetical protein